LQKHILRVYLTKKISVSIVHLAWFNLENNYTFSSKLQCKFPGKLCSLKSQPWTGCLLNSAQNIVGLLAWVRNNIYILCLSSSGISITPIIHRNQLASDQPGWKYMAAFSWSSNSNTLILFHPCCQETQAWLPAKDGLAKLKRKRLQVLMLINGIVPGKTTLWILQKHQTPKTQYEQLAQWLCSNSCHSWRYQSLHHSAWIVDAQVWGLVSDPNNYSASAGTLYPFLSGPRKQPGTVQFWQNDMVRNHPEKIVID